MSKQHKDASARRAILAEAGGNPSTAAAIAYLRAQQALRGEIATVPPEGARGYADRRLRIEKEFRRRAMKGQRQ